MLRSPHARLRHPRVLTLAVTVVLGASLGACGGGGGDDPAPSPGTDPVTPDPVTGAPMPPDVMTPDPVPSGGDDGGAPVAVDGSGLDAFADVDGGPLFRSMLNSARLNGPVLGDGSVSNADLRAPIPVTVDENETGLEVVGAWKLLDALSIVPAERGTYVVLLVRNPAAEEVCGARLPEAALLGAGGAALPGAGDVGGSALGNAVVVENPNTLDQLNGLDARFYFDGCIAPGDTTYLDISSSAPFDDVASLVIGRLDVSSLRDDLVPRRTGEGIRPLSYEVVADPLQPGNPDFDPEIFPEGPVRDRFASLAEPGFLVAVTMVNGSTDTLLAASWSGLVLDEAGLPLAVLRGGSSGADGFEEGVGIDPGEEVVLPIPPLSGYGFAGSASTLRVSLEWIVDEGIVNTAR